MYDFFSYRVITVKQVEDFGKEMKRLNEEENATEKKDMDMGCEPLIRRWLPCGPVNLCGDVWTMPVRRNNY